MLAVCVLSGCNTGRDASRTVPSAAEHGPTVTVDDGNFQQVVLEADKPVLVDFWATWCGPCQIVAPIVGQLAMEYEGRVTVAKLDIDQAAAIADRYNVSAIPTLIVFRQGREVSRVVGAASRDELAQKLDEALQ
jgi:thioredoxin 1